MIFADEVLEFTVAFIFSNLIQRSAQHKREVIFGGTITLYMPHQKKDADDNTSRNTVSMEMKAENDECSATGV